MNLLPRTPAPPFADLDEDQRARFEERARFVLRGHADGADLVARRLDESFASELEELEAAPALIVAETLLDQLHRTRCAAPSPHQATGSTAPETDQARPGEGPGLRAGAWLCHWPGRSLSTGEAEIASRGYFDVMDRPPLEVWIGTFTRRAMAASDALEVAVLSWVPPDEIDRARDGRAACQTGGLAFLEEVSDPLIARMRALEAAIRADWGD